MRWAEAAALMVHRRPVMDPAEFICLAENGMPDRHNNVSSQTVYEMVSFWPAVITVYRSICVGCYLPSVL